MKTCVLISGLPREFKRSFEYLDKYIFQPLQPTIVISTWKVVNEPVFEIEGTTRYPGEGSLDEFYQLYKPDIFDVEYWDEKREKHFDIKKYYSRKHPYASIIRSMAMYYKIWRCFQLSLDLGPFDIIIKARSDLKITETIPNKMLERINDILFTDAVVGGYNNKIVSDILFFSGPTIMEYVCNIYNHLDELMQIIPLFNPESLLTGYITGAEIPVEKGVDVEILRPACWNV